MATRRRAGEQADRVTGWPGVGVDSCARLFCVAHLCYTAGSAAVSRSWGLPVDFDLDAVTELCARMPEFGRLRIEAGVVVMERSEQVKDPAHLAAVLGRRERGESLVVQRFPAHWLVTFSRTIAAFPVRG